jgi:hypothetical protein
VTQSSEDQHGRIQALPTIVTSKLGTRRQACDASLCIMHASLHCLFPQKKILNPHPKE